MKDILPPYPTPEECRIMADKQAREFLAAERGDLDFKRIKRLVVFHGEELATILKDLLERKDQ